jgi:hypothetical protein
MTDTNRYVQLYVEEAKDFMTIAVNELTRKGMTREEALLAIEAALNEMRNEA